MIKKNILSITIFATVILAFYAYKWFSPRKTNKNEFVVGTCSGFPPYEALNEQGQCVGLDIDIAQLVAQALGKKLIIKDMSFDALILALKHNQIDCALAGISITPSRLDEIALVHYSGKPLTELPLIFWHEIPSNILTIKDLEHNDQKTICAQAGTIQHEIISSYNGLDVKILENISDLIMDIKYGKSIAAVLEPKVAATLQKQCSELKILSIPLNDTFKEFGTGIGINKKNLNLIKRVSSIIETLKGNGTIQKLESKWFSTGTSYDSQ